MDKVFRIAITAAAAGITALSLTAPAQAGNAVGAGLVGFGIGAILGSMMGAPEVYFVPPPPHYYGPLVYGPPDYDGPVTYGPMSRTPGPYYERPYPGPRTPPPAAHVYPRSKTPPPAAAQRRPATTRSATATAKATPVTVTPQQKAEAKFKSVQAKAKRDGVETLTEKDIEGLSYDQIKQLRGY